MKENEVNDAIERVLFWPVVAMLAIAILIRIYSPK